MARQDILNTLQMLKPELKARYKVERIALFGSFVRGQEQQASDIDVLVDFADDASLLDLVGLGIFLEEKLGRHVDVVPRRSLREELREAVLKEMVEV